MTVMLRKALWDIRWTAFWFAIGGAGYVLMMALFYPMVRSQAQAFEGLLAAYPKGLLVALGYSSIASFSGYMGGEALNLFWPVIVGVFATLGGASLVAKEVEDGTSETWLSVPASRWRLLIGKIAALGIALVGCVVACVVAVALGAAIVSATVAAQGLVAMAVVMTAFQFVVAGYSSVLSSLLSSRGTAAGISFAITLVFYFMYVVGGLSDQWKRLKDFSIFTAYTAQRSLETGSVDGASLAMMLAVAAVCVIAALLAFQRRDAI